MDVPGSVVLVTGASRGIGHFLARFFAARRARVVVTARTEPPLHALGEDIEKNGGDCFVYASDLRDGESLVALVDAVIEKYGTVDILINNGADVTSKPFLETSLEEIEGLIRTNVTGALQLSRLVAPLMTEKGRGMIVNISSLAGYKPNTAQTVYSVSKSAVNAMSEALRADLGPRGIRVMNVALASVGTDHDTAPGQTPVATFAHALLRAIEKEDEELFLSAASKWLMRLYKFYPPLARLRSS